MANRIQIRRHSDNSDTDPPGSLLTGELALNQADKKLYVGRHNGSNVEIFHLPTLQDITYGNGISGTVASGSNDNSSTLAVDLTDSNIFGNTTRKGIVQMSSDNFAESSGVITIKDNGVILGTETTGNYVASLVAGTGITVGSASEGATPTVAIDTSSSPTVAGITADDVRIGVTAANEIDTASGNLVLDSANGTVSVDDNLTVTGNLTVNGTTTTVNSTTVTIDDPIFTLGGDSAPGSDDNKDRGILGQYYDSSAKKMFFGMDDSNSHRFTYIPVATESTGVISGSVGDCQFATGYFTAISGAAIDGGTFDD
jgi:hypothetical protein